MIKPELLKMLVCPETRAPLKPVEPTLLDRMNQAIAAGKLKNRGGQPVRGPLEDGLVREDGQVLYPIVEGIPVMLIDESIPLAQLE